jgi:hypothetical protein
LCNYPFYIIYYIPYSNILFLREASSACLDTSFVPYLLGGSVGDTYIETLDSYYDSVTKEVTIAYGGYTKDYSLGGSLSQQVPIVGVLDTDIAVKWA